MEKIGVFIAGAGFSAMLVAGIFLFAGFFIEMDNLSILVPFVKMFFVGVLLFVFGIVSLV